MPAVPFGNLAEVVLARGLLLGAERAVIGGGGLQVAGLQAAPQRHLVLGRAERRAHHVRRGAREIRIAVHGVVEQQVPGEHFAEDALAFVARPRDRLERPGATIRARGR